jgi:hypothetical protein
MPSRDSTPGSGRLAASTERAEGGARGVDRCPSSTPSRPSWPRPPGLPPTRTSPLFAQGLRPDLTDEPRASGCLACAMGHPSGVSQNWRLVLEPRSQGGTPDLTSQESGSVARSTRSPACWRRPAPWCWGRNGPCRRDRARTAGWVRKKWERSSPANGRPLVRTPP